MKNKDPIIILTMLRNTFTGAKYSDDIKINFYQAGDKWLISVQKQAFHGRQYWKISSEEDQSALLDFINDVTEEGRK